MMVSLLLANRFPMLLWWGPQYIQIYNDAYRPVLGSKHPQFLGRPVRECWSEIFDVIGPLIDKPFQGGPSTWMEDIELEVNRHGYVEESHFTIAYSPVPDESAPHGIGGVLATVHEITEKVIAQRRVAILSELAARVAEAKTADSACQAAAATLAQHGKDIAGAQIYLSERGGTRLWRVCEIGVPAGSGGAELLEAGTGPLARVLRGECMQLSEFAGLGKAVALPINLGHTPAGVLAVGPSPKIALDAQYIAFLELLAAQISSGIGNAVAYDEERRRAEALAEIDRTKTAFFSNVSHEFRTPLTLILGPLEAALAQSKLPAAAREQLDVVRGNAQRLLKLVNSLLEFSRIEAGRIQAAYQATDLAACTRDLASMFRSTVERAGLHLLVDCPDLRAPVYVDRDMWEKIVLNLLSNAFKFTLKGRIEVRLRREAASAMLEVADTGVGIAADEMPRLFERFHRVEGSGGRTQEGSGIGLALVHELVRLHGGDIEAESAPGRGTTLRVRLPFGRAHLPPARVGTHPSGSGSSSAPSYVAEAARWLHDDARRHRQPAAGRCQRGARRHPGPALRGHFRRAYRAGRRQHRHARLRARPARAHVRRRGGARRRRGAGGRECPAPRPHRVRRHDAARGRVRSAAAVARERRAARRAGNPAVGARRRRGAHRGAGRRRRRLPRQAVLGARARDARRRTPRAPPRARCRQPPHGAVRDAAAGGAARGVSGGCRLQGPGRQPHRGAGLRHRAGRDRPRLRRGHGAHVARGACGGDRAALPPYARER